MMKLPKLYSYHCINIGRQTRDPASKLGFNLFHQAIEINKREDMHRIPVFENWISSLTSLRHLLYIAIEMNKQVDMHLIPVFENWVISLTSLRHVLYISIEINEQVDMHLIPVFENWVISLTSPLPLLYFFNGILMLLLVWKIHRTWDLKIWTNNFSLVVEVPSFQTHDFSKAEKPSKCLWHKFIFIL